MRAVSFVSSFAGGLASLTIAYCATAGAAEDFSKTVSAERAGRVQISNVAGSVLVTAWDRAEVDVKGRLGAGVERVDVSSSGGRVVIEVVLPKFSVRNGDAKLEVRVPADSRLDISTVSASIEMEGVNGASRLHSVSGNVRSEGGSADLEIKTVSGDVSVDGRSGEMRVATVSGDFALTKGAGELTANTTSGDMNITLSPARAVRVNAVSGDIRFQGRLVRDGRVEAETVSGDVSIAAAAEAGFEYEVSSFSGDINNCFKEPVSRSQYGPGSRLAGKRESGSGNVRLKTMSGDIDLCDR